MVCYGYGYEWYIKKKGILFEGTSFVKGTMVGVKLERWKKFVHSHIEINGHYLLALMKMQHLFEWVILKGEKDVFFKKIIHCGDNIKIRYTNKDTGKN